MPAIAPCMITVDNSLYFNFFDYKTPLNYSQNETIDISRPVQHSHDYLYVGTKGAPYTIQCNAIFDNVTSRENFKVVLSNSTGLSYYIYDCYGFSSGPSLLKSVKFTEEKILRGACANPAFCGGTATLDIELEVIPF